MTTWLLPSARPISCKDCPAFQRFHISVRWAAESFHRLACFMNTTFRGKIYTRWCCIDRLSRHGFPETGFRRFPVTENPVFQALARDRTYRKSETTPQLTVNADRFQRVQIIGG